MDMERKNYLIEIEVDLKRFEKFKEEFSSILKKRHGIEIGDCIEESTLLQCFDGGETPTEVVEWIATKRDLDRIDTFC